MRIVDLANPENVAHFQTQSAQIALARSSASHAEGNAHKFVGQLAIEDHEIISADTSKKEDTMFRRLATKEQMRHCQTRRLDEDMLFEGLLIDKEVPADKKQKSVWVLKMQYTRAKRAFIALFEGHHSDYLSEMDGRQADFDEIITEMEGKAEIDEEFRIAKQAAQGAIGTFRTQLDEELLHTNKVDVEKQTTADELEALIDGFKKSSRDLKLQMQECQKLLSSLRGLLGSLMKNVQKMDKPKSRGGKSSGAAPVLAQLLIEISEIKDEPSELNLKKRGGVFHGQSSKCRWCNGPRHHQAARCSLCSQVLWYTGDPLDEADEQKNETNSSVCRYCSPAKEGRWRLPAFREPVLGQRRKFIEQIVRRRRRLAEMLRV